MNILTFVVVLVGWIFSLCLHEFSHALVAYYGGDTTVKEKGYLTFNPLKYTHPVYSLLLPLLFLVMGGIGLPGGAVYIETWRLRSREWRSAVSLAGPLANLVVAIVLGSIIRFGHVTSKGIWPGLAFLVFLQVSSVVLNLIPLPPFDGFGVVGPYLPDSISIPLAQTQGMLAWVVFFLLWYLPAFNNAFWSFISYLTQLAGVPFQLVAQGYNLFRFWG